MDILQFMVQISMIGRNTKNKLVTFQISELERSLEQMQQDLKTYLAPPAH